MTAKQKKLYWGEWGAARRALIRAHYEPKEADARRLEIHAEVLGIQAFDPTDPGHRSAVSSKGMTNAVLDQVLAAFRALSDSGNLNAQIKADNQPLIRARGALSALMKRMDASPEYVEGIAQNTFHQKLDYCNENQVKSVIVYLNKHRLRRIKRMRGIIDQTCLSGGIDSETVNIKAKELFDCDFIKLEFLQLRDLNRHLAQQGLPSKQSFKMEQTDLPSHAQTHP